MFIYNKKLQYPVKIDKPNPRLASIIISQYGGPDGELGASMRYLSQRYSMPFDELKGLLTDIGTEELGHLEMIGAIVHQLTRNLKDSQIQDSAFAPYFVDHTTGVYPTAASGFPWSAASMQVKGDPIADLTEDLAAEAEELPAEMPKPTSRQKPINPKAVARAELQRAEMFPKPSSSSTLETTAGLRKPFTHWLKRVL